MYGLYDPDLAINANNIGMILKDKGDLDGALEYAQRALKIGERVYGPEHPTVAKIANNIGSILQAKGDLDGALQYAQRALDIGEKVYDQNIPAWPSTSATSAIFSMPKVTSTEPCNTPSAP